ncbi:MAG: C-GCAxxG-C-C family protein [Clostridia bacterium]|nr:C-GCAxxG-C-C family protein [Clostridia bacterium]
MSERVIYAEEMFKKGYMCSQAVFAAFSEIFGLEKDIALKIGNGFGGGIARKQEVCGAVSGAVMLIGLKYGKVLAEDNEAHEKTYSTIECFCEKFTERNKSINCYEILGCNLSTAKERELFSTVCLKCIRDAAEIVEDLLIKNNV